MKDNFRIAYAHQSCGWSCCSAFPKHPWFSLTQCASWQDNSEKGEMSEDDLSEEAGSWGFQMLPVHVVNETFDEKIR